jgi:membrane protein DedA with SNARE-associated domain
MGGYVFGEVLIAVVKDIKSYQMHILGTACLVALSFWIFRLWRKHRQHPNAGV